MTTAICWHKTPHGGNDTTTDPRHVTHHTCASTTPFLGVVLAGATRAAGRRTALAAAAWWAGTRACLHQPPAVVPCGYTRNDGIHWRCGRTAHDGDNHWDPAYGWIPATTHPLPTDGTPE